MSVVTLGIEYFADPTKGAPVENGFVYVGEPDTDPTLAINQKDVFLLQENGTLVPTAQPVELGPGGVAVYLGSPVQIITDDVYSIAVHDKNDAQVYYQPNNSSATETGAGVYADLRATTGTADGNTVMVAGKTTIGDGYGGQFFWDSSDFSAEVTNDPLEKKYVPPTVDLTGAAGSWVRADGLSYISYDDLRLQDGLFDGQNITIGFRTTVGDGGGGIFSWSSADLSTFITADTASGLYVAPTSDLTGASGAWVRQYNGVKSFRWFGAIGDGDGAGGGTDDTVAVAAAIATCADKISGEGLTYNLTAVIAKSDTVKIYDTTFDISGVPDQGAGVDNIIEISGTQGAAVPLTGDTLIETTGITVGSTATFAADDYAWMESTAVWEATGSVFFGQIVRIKSVDSGVGMTLYEPVHLGYLTADTATISPLDMVDGVEFINSRFLGAGANFQAGLVLDKCSNAQVIDSHNKYVDYASVILSRCVSSNVHRSSFRWARASGLSYGVGVFNGCDHIEIAGNYGEDIRHLVTIGDNGGINYFINVHHNNGAACRESSIDAHPAADHCTFNYNISNHADSLGGNSDGIVFQGRSADISHNRAVGFSRHGVLVQGLVDGPAVPAGDATIIGNTCIGNAATTGSGVLVLLSETDTIGFESVVMDGNKVKSCPTHFRVFAENGSIGTLSIGANTSLDDATVHAVRVRAGAAEIITDTSINGGCYKSSSTVNISLLGDAADAIVNVVVSGAVLNGGNVSIGATNVNALSVGANAYKPVSSRYSLTGVVSFEDSMPESFEENLTIAAGVISPVSKHIKLLTLDTEAAAATDDLDTITSVADGMRATLVAVDNAHSIVVKDSTGNLRLAGGVDFTLADTTDTISLIDIGGTWVEVSRSDN